MSIMKMDHCFITIILLASGLWGVHSLRITNLTVPNYVKNGTEESVVLDCEYEFEEDTDSQLVVKWFYNDDPNPVYQWIRQYGTRLSSDTFKGIVNTDFELPTGDEFTKYRALNILKPTTEISGKYACYVTSHGGNDVKEDTMIVYALPSSVYMNVSVVNSTVNIMCIVEGVSPIPEIEMFQTNPGEIDGIPVDEVDEHHTREEDNTYDVLLTTYVSEIELESDGLHYFSCIVSIPGAEYQKKVVIPYFSAANHDNLSGKPNDDDDDNGTDAALNVRPPTAVTIILASALLMFLW